MAAAPEGTLMARAAAGLAAAVIDLLGGGYGAPGAAAGRRAATTAVTRCTPARCWPVAAARWRRCCCPRRPTPPGSPRCGSAGGRVVAGARRRTRPDVLVDGIVGIGGRPGLRPAAVEELDRHPGVPVVAVDVPVRVSRSTTAGSTGRTCVADVTVTFGTHKVAHLVEPAAGACGAVTLVDIGLDLPGGAGLGAAAAPTSPRCCRCRSRTPTSTPGVWSALRTGGALPAAPGCCPSPARRPGWPGWCGTPAPTRCSTRSGWPIRRWSPPRGGCRRGWSARAAASRRRRTWPPRWRTASRWSWTPTGSRTCPLAVRRRPRCSLRTPGELARMLGVERADGGGPAARARPGGRGAVRRGRACSRGGTRWSRSRAAGSR